MKIAFDSSVIIAGTHDMPSHLGTRIAPTDLTPQPHKR